MKKKSFEIREEDILFEGQDIVVDEDQVGSPLIVEDPEPSVEDSTVEVSAWTDAQRFVKYCVSAVRTAPKISASNLNSLKRAIAYYDNLEREIEQGVMQDAEQADLNMGQLEEIETACEQIDVVRGQLRVAAERIGIVKKAAKAARFTYVVDPFLFSIARICVNAKVSGGKNIEDVYAQLKSIYKISDREELSLRQLISDMGYPVHGSMVADHGAFDMIKQYFG